MDTTNIAVAVDPYTPLPNPGAKPYVADFTSGKISLTYISSGRTTQPSERILLINLVNLFATALPSMPRAHIIRTLFSHNTQCLAIVARGYVVRAGLAYHVLPQRDFAELVFVAARQEDQSKGYAAYLMRGLRSRLRVQTTIKAILAYADNSARGWFAHQGFGDVTLPRERWAGYIRDYDGAQLMQTHIHACKEEVFRRDERGEVIFETKLNSDQGWPMYKLPFDPVQEPWIARSQYDTVRGEIFKRRPHIGRIYPGLTFQPGEVKNPETIPGLTGRGLASHMHDGGVAQLPRTQRVRNLLTLLVDTMKGDAASEPFLHPVDVSIAPRYNDLITEPMDLGTLQANVKAGVYDPVRHGIKAFLSDANRIFDNCRQYNGPRSPYTVKAERLRRKLEMGLEKWSHIVREVEETGPVEMQMDR